jgi:hypothetical protein
MTEKELVDWGLYADLTLTEKIYAVCGIATRWIDYSIAGSIDPDNAWDMDAYYGDFDRWWKNLPLPKKQWIYDQIINEK